MALDTSPEKPAPVRTIANLIGQWISRLGSVWVEGQVTEVNRRPGAGVVFVTLRDPVADVSLRCTCQRALFDEVAGTLADGARVIVRGRPTFYMNRGTLSLALEEIRPVGVGELLARVERLRTMLAAEGLFAAGRKRPLPFLPRVVGLVSGRGGAAEHDVLENARRRWPGVRFRVENVAVQGPLAVGQVTEAVQALDRDPEVDVIVVARGGGSLEDLLPFSDEALLRVVAACRTPLVSAIGHEQDAPLLDHVADVRASTPTDAAKRVVPDVGEEQRLVAHLRDRGRRSVTARLDREQHTVDGLRARPVLAAPHRELDRRAADVSGLRDRARRCLAARLDRARDELVHTRARVRALSPAATLDRGYAIVQRADGRVVAAYDEVEDGDTLGVRLASGGLDVRVTGRRAGRSGEARAEGATAEGPAAAGPAADEAGVEAVDGAHDGAET
ncbi:MAG: exodeoxyribonuclease VII large subunit [Actinomycetes bacterium]